MSFYCAIQQIASSSSKDTTVVVVQFHKDQAADILAFINADGHKWRTMFTDNPFTAPKNNVFEKSEFWYYHANPHTNELGLAYHTEQDRKRWEEEGESVFISFEDLL